MIAYTTDFDKARYIFFSVENEEMLIKYYKILNKASNSIRSYLIVNLCTMKISKNQNNFLKEKST